ncbi:MAG: anthranilate phosphoribosyltransferase [Chloroflexota bacterium]
MSQPIVQKSIQQLFAGNNLSEADADAAMSAIMNGEATDAQIGAFLAALRMKGETVDEITGCAQAMKRSAVQVKPETDGAPILDVVGTGGDGSNTFNVSTTAAFVVAGAGYKVAKHGNVGVSSKSGAADVLESLGTVIRLTGEQAESCIEEAGISFLFAPAFHPAMRHAIGPRRELAARTIFNILGPLTNPASASHMLVGVFDGALVEPMARVLGQMGKEAAYVVHGADGLDELSITGVNQVSRLRDGQVTNLELDPRELGFDLATLDDLKGGEPAENADITRGILSGEIKGPKRDIVLLNAAVAISTVSGDFQSGLTAAAESIDSGAAGQRLEVYVKMTQDIVA